MHQPRLAGRVEAARCDLAQVAPLAADAVLAVHAQQHRHGRHLIRTAEAADVSARLAVQHRRELIAERAHSPAAKALDAFEAAVVGGHFERFERLDAELVVDALGQLRPDAGHAAEEGRREALPEVLEERQATRLDEAGDARAEALAHARQPHQPLYAVGREDLGEGALGMSDALGGRAVGLHAVWVGVALNEPVGHVVEGTRDGVVGHGVGMHISRGLVGS